MALNFKIEPAQGTSIVDLLSDTEVSPEVPLQVPGMKSPERPARSGTPPDIHCSICLEEYNNKCHPDICWHKFCFECLKRWALIESSCPLCKKTFKHICHTVVDECFTERYEVPFVHQTQRRTDEYEQQPRIFLRPFAELSPRFEATSFSSFNLDLYLDLFTRRADGRPNNFGGGNLLSIRDNNFNIGYQGLPDLRIGFRNNPVDNLIATAENVMASIDNAQTMRRRVYQDNMWAEPLPDLSGHYRSSSAVYYRENPSQILRLNPFILRDMTAIRSVAHDIHRSRSVSGNVDLTRLITNSMLSFEIRGMQMINLLTPYFRGQTEHFLHELSNFAQSPYDLIGYDRNVQYTTRGYNTIDLVDLTVDTPYFNLMSEPIEIPEPIRDVDSIQIVLSASVTLDPSEVIEINSSGESDVENVEMHSTQVDDTTDVQINSVESAIDESAVNTPPLDATFLRDQPSTSTGIRHPPFRPNPRYSLRSHKVQPNHQQNCPDGIERKTTKRMLMTVSSDDEAIETNTSGTKTRGLKSRKVLAKKKEKINKSKLKKKKTNVIESQPKVQIHFRTLSESESSSSCDTD